MENKYEGEKEMINKKLSRIIEGTLVAVILTLTSVNGNVAQAAYDSKKAIDYADKNYDKYNSSFPNYNNDCTNYVSQCLNKGGIGMNNYPDSLIGYTDLGKVLKTKSCWSAKKYTRTIAGIISKTDFVSTTTWSRVDVEDSKTSYYGLQDYLNNYKNKKVIKYNIDNKGIKKLIADAEVGDVVQIKKKKEERYSHSYIIGKIKKNKNGVKDVFVYAHTGSRGAEKDDALLIMKKAGAFDDYDKIVLIDM